MPNDNAIKFGILKCRDLVELYYGARMVASIVENAANVAQGITQEILKPDPRRIRYEIIVGNGQSSAAGFAMGTPAADTAGLSQNYNLPGNETLIVERDFLTDMDTVCLPVQMTNSGPAVTVSTRETFLTPIPVDEMP